MELVLSLNTAVSRARPLDADEETLWLARARRGEIAALDALMNAHRARILNLAFQILRNESDAEDAAQEAFLRAFHKLNSFREQSGFGTWLYKVALNVCLERKRAQRETEPLADELPAPPHPLADERLALEWALDRLSEPQRIVLILREWHGLSYEEMAVALGVPTGTVRSRLSAARDEFRRLWAQMEAE